MLPAWLKPWEWPERIMSFRREWYAMREAVYKAKSARLELQKLKAEATKEPCREAVADALGTRRIVGATLDELCKWLPKFSGDQIYDALCYWEREGKARRGNQGRWMWGPPPEWSGRLRGRF